MSQASDFLFAAVCAGAWTAAAHGDGLPPSTVAGSPPGFNYPLALDSTTADPKNHRVIYEDANVRVLEVTLWPYEKERRHGHAYPSFFVSDEPQPKMQHDTVDVARDRGMPPFGFLHPAPEAPPTLRCLTLGPQDPHAETIVDSFPQHFWRMEFKRPPLPGAEPPKGLAPPSKRVAGGEPFSAAWPFPIAYETVRAAPANFIQRYDDGHVRIVEVSVAPGDATPVFGSPYYAVEGFDTPLPGTPGGASLRVRAIDPNAPLAMHAELGTSEAPKGLNAPICRLAGPLSPRQLINTGKVPVHYYRFELLRIDGERFRTDWRTMYPDMAEGPPAPRAP